MSIHTKTLLIVGITFLIMLVSFIIASQLLVMKGFIRLELQDVRLNVKRVINEFSNILSSLNAINSDWSAWDETYFFVQGENEEYIEENMMNQSFTNLRINFMLFFNNSAQLVFAKFVDLEMGEEVPLDPGFVNETFSSDTLLEHVHEKSSVTSFLMMSTVPMFVASRPILRNDNTGPIAGTLIMGRALDASEVKRLGELTHVPFSIQPLDDAPIPPDFQEARASLSKNEPIAVNFLDSERIVGYALQKDIHGDSAFMLKVEIPRAIYKHGQKTLLYYIFSLLSIGLVFIFLLIFLLKRTVLTPLTQLSDQIGHIDKIDDLSQRIPVSNRDEFGNLATMLNNMLGHLAESTDELAKTNEQLKREIEERKQTQESLQKAYQDLQNTQAQLIQSSKLASIGELAAGVAHELNQPLMVIRTNAQFVRRTLEKGRMNTEQLLTLFELAERNTKRMMDIINHLRTFSRQSQGEFSLQNINTIIENAFLMVGEQLRLRNITVKKHLTQDIPKVRGDANQLEQVFLNLITNARDAIEVKGAQEPRQIEIVTRVADNDNDWVEILVKDSGEGITKDALENIFNPFFTTKEIGKGTGLGLSISYGIVKEHQGKIEVVESNQEGTISRVQLPSTIDE